MTRRAEKRDKNKIENPGVGLTSGCLFALASTLITCLLLFINGGLVAAICDSVMGPDEQIITLLSTDSNGVIQFILFVGPVLLVIVEWMMIDFVIDRIRRWP